MEWISVKTSLPGLNWYVLVTDGTNYTLACLVLHNGKYDWMNSENAAMGTITYWAVLPKPPIGEGEQ